MNAHTKRNKLLAKKFEYKKNNPEVIPDVMEDRVSSREKPKSPTKKKGESKSII